MASKTSSDTVSILKQFRLDDQCAVITGGNRGLGYQMARAFAEAGANIVIASRDELRNRESAGQIRSDFGCDVLEVACDVTSEADMQNLTDKAVDAFDKIDILVNSAGINIRGAIDDLSKAEFEKVMEVNVTGTWLACNKVVPVMKENGYGRIINVGSMLSLVAIPERTPYATSKGAVLQLTRALAIELAKENITVNALLPGPFATELNLPLTDDPEKYQAFLSNIPMGRWGELHEIGGLALFLASSASSYVTGSGFSIDGGWTAK